MQIECERDGGRSRMTVEGDLTIYSAADFKQQLLEEIDRATAIELQLGSVEELDSAGVQVLLMGLREAGRRNVPFELTQHSETVFDVINLLGLQSQFGEPVVIPADRSQA